MTRPAVRLGTYAHDPPRNTPAAPKERQPAIPLLPSLDTWMLTRSTGTVP